MLAIAPRAAGDERPVWQRSLRRLEWPNGVVARCYWQLAATEALDSRWAAQTGRRAQHIAGMLRGGGTSA